MKYNWRLDIKQIEELYKQGYSCSEIGKMLGATRQAIWEKMKNAGVKTRKKKLLPFIVYDDRKWTINKTTGYYRQTNSRKKHIALHRYVYEKETNTVIPENYDIHHIDYDKTNNKLENLQLLLKSEHTKLHQDAKHN